MINHNENENEKKKRSHRYDINKSRPRYWVQIYKKWLRMMMPMC